jgi:hypothetical protein
VCKSECSLKIRWIRDSHRVICGMPYTKTCYNMLANSWVTEQLLASQEWLSSMGLIWWSLDNCHFEGLVSSSSVFPLSFLLYLIILYGLFLIPPPSFIWQPSPGSLALIGLLIAPSLSPVPCLTYFPPKNRGSWSVQNTSNHLPEFTVLYPRSS